MELESKLASYRAKKKRETQLKNIKEKLSTLFGTKQEIKSIPEEKELLPVSSDEDNHLQTCEIVEENQSKYEEKLIPKSSWLRTGMKLTAFGLWLFLYYIFITLQFGIIYLIVSTLFGIYFNTRTGPKDQNEVSAYSVFNKNCESIDGTLKAEQFEREIRFGAQSVH